MPAIDIKDPFLYISLFLAVQYITMYVDVKPCYVCFAVLYVEPYCLYLTIVQRRSMVLNVGLYFMYIHITVLSVPYHIFLAVPFSVYEWEAWNMYESLYFMYNVIVCNSLAYCCLYLTVYFSVLLYV